MTDSLVLLDRDWRIVYVNRNVPGIVDHPAEALIGRNHWEVFPDARKSEVEDRYRLAVTTGEPQHFEVFFAPLHRWFELHAHPNSDGLAVYFRDVTERRNAEQALRESRELLVRSEAQLQLITDALPAYVAYIDPDFRYVRVNRTYTEWFGCTADEMIGRTIEEVLGPSAANIRHHMERAFAGERQQFETSVQNGNQTRILHVTQIPDRDPSGHVRGIIAHGRDITDRIRAQAALRESEERFRRLSASSPVGIFQAAMDGRILYLNPQTEIIFDLPESELLGHGWLSRLHPEDAQRVTAGWAVANAAGQPYTVEYRLVLPDNEIRHVSARTAILFDDKGQSTGIVGTVDDITNRKRAEHAVRQSEKLAAVGRLASSIAHEINNPLEAVTNLLYLSRNSSDVQEIQGYLDLAERELRRVSVIANQTLRFHKQSTGPRSVTCDELIASALSVYQGRLVNSGIEVSKRSRAAGPLFCFDGEIRQVISNLIGNAIDAMNGRGGTLLVRSREATRWNSDRESGHESDRGLLITVADTGSGMSSSTLTRIFEPFFTTKDIGGTGLGLWISQDIITRHHGTLRVRSSQRRGHSGTVFTVFLPFNAPIV